MSNQGSQREGAQYFKVLKEKKKKGQHIGPKPSKSIL